MKSIILLLLMLCLTGCTAQEAPETTAPAVPTTLESPPPVTTAATVPTQPADPVQELLDQMSLQQRVGQLFLARCDDSVALEHIRQYHLGGFVLFGRDFEKQNPYTLEQKLCEYQEASPIPLLLAVDEEGGSVTRISRYPAFRESPLPSPRETFRDGGLDRALENELEKCLLLSSLGLNVNLGPVCDLTTDPEAFLYDRSLGQSAQTTSEFVSRTVLLMGGQNIGSVLKHFPGYGNNADTHVGIARDRRSLQELEGSDLLPFAAGIEAGCGAILVSHTFVDALDGETPASLSPAVHRYLRETMGFEGVILTDDLVMEAITDLYGAGEAAVLAVLAGNDLLCATEYITQYEAVLEAVMSGRIDMDTLDNAVRNVLEWKLELGLIDAPSDLHP